MALKNGIFVAVSGRMEYVQLNWMRVQDLLDTGFGKHLTEYQKGVTEWCAKKPWPRSSRGGVLRDLKCEGGGGTISYF